MEAILNQVLLAQSTEKLRAAPYERCDESSAYRKGFRDCELMTRIGTLTLRIPRHRNGNFSRIMFSRYQRSEQALVLVMIGMVINGVSSRKIGNITEKLCVRHFPSRWSMTCARSWIQSFLPFRIDRCVVNIPFSQPMRFTSRRKKIIGSRVC